MKESLEEVERRGGEAWLSSLQKRPFHKARMELQQLPGVGAKVSHRIMQNASCGSVLFQVADCVCLMGLGHMEAVPVDVHVRRLAHRDYGVGGAGGSLTPAVYDSVGKGDYNIM